MRHPASLLAIAALLAGPGFAQEATQAEAEALVKAAIAYAKTRGREAAFKEITKPGGLFHKRGGELYVFVYDLNGRVMAHGQGRSKVGINQVNARDPDGREFVRERIQLATSKGKGWHDYKYRNPASNKLENKTSYIELWEGLIFGAGIYKK